MSNVDIVKKSSILMRKILLIQGGEAIDLSPVGTEVRFDVRNFHTKKYVETKSVSIINPINGEVSVEGKITLPVGCYEGEFKVFRNDDNFPIIVPDNAFIRIEVIDSVSVSKD